MFDCPTPGKFRYQTRRDARLRIRLLRNGCRPYLCACGFWHVGHLPQAIVHGVVTRNIYR